MAIAVPHILGGTYVVETVFSYPGLGTLTYESARYKDYNLLMLLCILSGILVILCSMAAEKINEWLDPRLRVTCGERKAQEKKTEAEESTEVCEANVQPETEHAEQWSMQENRLDVLQKTASADEAIKSDFRVGTEITAEHVQPVLDPRFRVVGIRPSGPAPAQKNISWYQNKPLFPVLVLAAIILGCICADWIMTKDPAYMDLLNCNVHLPYKTLLFLL